MNERTIELLKSLDGWDSLEIEGDKLEAIRKEQEAEGRNLASLFHQAFVQNPAGQRVLEVMIKQTLMRPTVKPASSQFEAGIREGRADLVRQILLNLEIAEGAV